MSDKTATELLNPPKAYLAYRKALEWEDERIAFVANEEATLARIRREREQEEARKALAITEAAAIIREATTGAEQIVGAAQGIEKDARGAVALLASDEAQLAGRVNELRVEEKRLTDRIKTLAVKVGALEAVES